MFEFDWRSPLFGGRLGACHGLDLPFVFNTLATTTGPKGITGLDPPQDLAELIHSHWVNFASGGAPPWPQFNGDSRITLQLYAGHPAREPVLSAAGFVPAHR